MIYILWIQRQFQKPIYIGITCWKSNDPIYNIYWPLNHNITFRRWPSIQLQYNWLVFTIFNRTAVITAKFFILFGKQILLWHMTLASNFFFFSFLYFVCFNVYDPDRYDEKNKVNNFIKENLCKCEILSGAVQLYLANWWNINYSSMNVDLMNAD